MITPTQDILNDIDNPIVVYSTFWQRFFASIIDGLVLSPFIFIDTFNKTTWKNYPIFAISLLITLLYKPVLESKYGATLGKMALKLTIVNTDFQKANVTNIILRNIFDIANRLLIGIVTLITFNSTGFEDVNSLADYGNLSNVEAGANWITIGMSVVILVDALVLIVDSRRQALHDKIAKTFVIQK